ncbi:MAG: DUF4209 domain-containing protein [Quadrisphaera sp.]
MTEEHDSPAPGSIDPAWWSAAFVDAEAGETEEPELISDKLFALAGQAPEDSLQRETLTVLARATSAMLEPEDWDSPFSPAMQYDGRRTAVPDDLDASETTLLGQLAPLISQSPLRARAADVAWTYGDRRRRDLLVLAIEAYLDLPLDKLTWVRIARDSWRRALELARRSGKATLPQLLRATERLSVMALDPGSEARLVADGSQLLREFGRLSSEQAVGIADQVRSRAGAVLTTNTYLSRRLEEEARAWYSKGQQPDLALDCTARIAQTFVLEAEQRLERNFSAAMTSGRLYEQAVATLRKLPARYRDEHGLEERIRELRERAGDSRQALLESMVVVESDPIDLSESARVAREAVSGKSSGQALGEFCKLRPAFDLEGFMAEAREQALGSLARIFAQETYSVDGQRVAARGAGVGQTDEDYVWAQAIRNYDVRLGAIVTGALLPAQEALIYEHRYTYAGLLRLCEQSPSVPLGHEALWARGIWHGFRQDYPSAVSLLVPQMEHLVRTHLKHRKVHTLMVEDRTGVETEKSLGALLEVPELEGIFGKTLVFELRALLVSKEGANLRNTIAHGIFRDQDSISHHTIYTWWLGCFLALVPLFTDGGTAAPDDGDA